MKVGAVVLASGTSERFGKNKLTADFCGRSVISWALTQIPPSVDRVVVVTRSEDVADRARAMDANVIVHDLPNLSDTIRLGVAQMRDMDACIFLVADQPALSRATVEKMLRVFAQDPTRILRAAFAGAPGNPVLFPACLFGELESLSPGESGSSVIRRHGALVALVEAGAAFELMDVDTPEQMERLKRVLSENPLDI